VRLRPGLVFLAPGLTGDIDHACILLTEPFNGDEEVVVNLTDYRNIFGSTVDIPAGTWLTPEFQTQKRSTIHYAYAQRIGSQELEDLLGDLRAKSFGCCESQWLSEFRLQLFESEDTPPAVITFCEDFDWGM
jgi:hypothetical protein